jgi:uncharacterized membrane protein
MARTAGAVWKVLAVLGILAHQALVHLALARSSTDPVSVALLVAPMVALACWILWRSSKRLLCAVIVAGAAGAIFVAHGAGLGVAALYGVPHAAAYVFMLWLFGRTLVPGKEAFITRLARQVRGTLPPELETYTRRLTLAWCGFFAAQLAVSALLLVFATLQTWSLFINVLNWPLLALMFAGDYFYRLIRFRDPPSSIANAIQAYVKDRASTVL